MTEFDHVKKLIDEAYLIGVKHGKNQLNLEEEEPVKHKPENPSGTQMERDDGHYKRGYEQGLKERDTKIWKEVNEMIDKAYLEGKKEGEKNLSRECDAAHDYGYSKGINDAVQKLHGKK